MNTKLKGGISEAHVLAALLKAGKTVLTPFGDCNRYDLATEEDGVFTRVQVKTARLSANGEYITFNACSISKLRGKTVHRTYYGQVDIFAAYCPELDKVYLIPVDACKRYEVFLRLKPARNGQTSGVRMAADFQFPPVAHD